MIGFDAGVLKNVGSKAFEAGKDLFAKGQVFNNGFIEGLKAGKEAVGAGSKAAELSKLDKFSQGANGVAAGVGAAMSVANTITSIIGTVEQQKMAKEQQKMAQKQYNLELKKLQQQELNDNKLAATIDKTWGGDGKIANTLDYGNHAGDKANASGLHGSNQNHGYITSREDSNVNNSNVESRSSLNTPTLSTQQAIAPAGYSESLSGKDVLPEDDENATAS